MDMTQEHKTRRGRVVPCRGASGGGGLPAGQGEGEEL